MSQIKIQKLFRIGIRQKMILVLISVLTLSLGITGWYSIKQQEQELYDKIQIHGQNLVRITAISLTYSVVGYDYHSIQLLLDELVKTEDISYAILINSSGNTMAESGTQSNNKEIFTTFKHDIVFDKKIIAELTLSHDNSYIIKQLKDHQLSVITRETILILLISLGVFLALSYIIIRPIKEISKALDENIDEYGNILKDINYQCNDEFGFLASQFNIMRHKLNIVTDQLRSKIVHANKELELQNTQLKIQSEKLTEANEKLELLTITDALTNLYNRRHFDYLLNSELSFANRHDEKFSMIVFDIDHFKKINDTYGHNGGDIVLSKIAALLQRNLRKADIACRIGGEEFAIICRHTGIKQSKKIAEKLRSNFEKASINVNSEIISITASFGIVTFFNSNIKTPDDFYHHADNAMYYSKEHGRNCVHHTVDLDKTPISFTKKIRIES
jgi:diguanylate cyclase (GGDEF)-like protein